MTKSPAIYDIKWRRSSRCVANGACVEVAPAGGLIAVRESKTRHGSALSYSREEFEAFVAGVKAGNFDDLLGDRV